MESKIYRHKDILIFFPDLSPRSLVSWAEKGLLIPDHGDAAGRGTMRQYSFDNVVQAGVIRELMAFGLTFRDIILVDNHWKSEMKRFNYDCVLSFQKATFRSKNTMPYRLDVRVDSMENFKKNKADVIWSASSYNTNGDLVQIGPDVSYTGALFINVTRIYQLIKTRLPIK